MVKRVFIVHGWGGSSKEPIHQWLRKELELKGFQVNIHNMPDTEHPKIKEWVNFLSKMVRKCDKDTYFFGHSIGCQTIIRYLETLKNGEEAGGAVLLAGWFKLKNLSGEKEEEIAKSWLETPINFDKVKKSCKKIAAFLSSDDPYNFVKENSDIFKNDLNAEVVIEKEKGHFTEDDDVLEIPEVLDKLISFVIESD